MASGIAQSGTVLALSRDAHSAGAVAHVVAATSWLARARGLLGKRHLAIDEGIYLAPCKSVHTLGMRFDIDLVFVDGDLRVVRVVKGLAPWRAAGARRAFGVIELGSGAVERHGLRCGDVLTLTPCFGSTQENVA